MAGTTQPIKNREDVERLKAYYRTIKPNARNHAYKNPAKIQSLTERIGGMKQDIEKSEEFKNLDNM